MEKKALRIAVVLPVKETYDYAVPDHLADRAQVGCRALVPFRNRKVIGYVLKKKSMTQERDLKEILEIMDSAPLFHEKIVPFFEWLADYYFYPIGRLFQSLLPGGLNPVFFNAARITEKGVRAMALLPSRSQESLTLKWISENPGKRIPFPYQPTALLQKKGWLILEKKRRERRTGPLKRKFVRIKKGMDPEALVADCAGSLRAKNEVAFLRAFAGREGIRNKDLLSRFSNGDYLIKKWMGKNILESYLGPVSRQPADGQVVVESSAPVTLYHQQERALEHLKKGLDDGRFSTFMLHGVTGSGKTEVYYRAIQHALKLGKQAIMMVPEIALAVYMEGIFTSRMGSRVAVYHSGLSEGERYDQWMRMLQGEVDLVLGARSALFAPLKSVGLIIVDEEHDFSYKQEEAPRYHARDAAVVRGKMEKAVVLLGSGTPSIQSFYNGQKGRYTPLSMPERIEKRPPPHVHVIDMKIFEEDNRENEIISPPLREALDDTLKQGKQTILFLNRRGFHRVFLCRHCGQSIQCKNCNLALIHHLKEDSLSCHYCGFKLRPERTCPACGRQGVKAYGFGTERLEEQLNRLYPACRIARLDRDSTRRKGRTFQILQKFSRHELDILVGTQMITKGYDFPDVTLVGVIAADFSLGFPDFRAGERTFQILAQVAGRTGRGDQGGRVIVQTFNPEHYAITTAKNHDYVSFYHMEKALREQLGYPPFSFLACLRFQGNSMTRTAEKAQQMGQAMNGLLARWPKRGKEIQILGPVEAPLSKIRGKHRWQILIKSKRAALLNVFLKEVEGFSGRVLRASGVNMTIDVDPYQML
ncbi:MAG: primosomal protein N' [Pseudomonadota bacterium]